MTRSVLSILVGVAVYVALAFAASVALAEVSPEWFGPRGEVTRAGVLGLILALYAVFAVFAGWLAALLARRGETRHALAVGVAVAGLAVVSAVTSPDAAPGWFHAALVALGVPAAWLGGWARARLSGRTVSQQAFTKTQPPPPAPKRARKRRK
ncbi:MAG TPA: hypothetical protein VHG91_04680 [Longimicrobium sp.]|nr:hypothetical protein [Longimicrobium sp.]